jgi:hypothetical protein
MVINWVHKIRKVIPLGESAEPLSRLRLPPAAMAHLILLSLPLPPSARTTFSGACWKRMWNGLETSRQILPPLSPILALLPLAGFAVTTWSFPAPYPRGHLLSSPGILPILLLALFPQPAGVVLLTSTANLPGLFSLLKLIISPVLV